MTLGRNDADRGLQAWMAARSRRLAFEVAIRLLDRIEKGSALDDGQRVWLVRELEAELADQIEDIRETREVPSDRSARETVVTRGVIRWLRNGDDPGPSALGFLEKQQEFHRPWQGDSDRAAEAAYAAAIADLRDGDVVSSGAPPQFGDPECRRRVLDFQGRRVRELMESRGLTIGGLADLSGDGVVELVAIVLGLNEMAFRDCDLISGAFDVEL